MLLAALTSVVLIEFVLDDVPETFTGGYKIGVLVDRLSWSYVAAFIFFFVDRHAKSHRDKKTLLPVVIEHIYSLQSHAGIYANFIEIMFKVKFASKYPTEDEAQNVIRLSTESKEGTKNWYNVLASHQPTQKETIDKLLHFTPHLDTELLTILHNISECSLFKYSKLFTLETIEIDWEKKQPMHGALGKYFNAIRALQSEHCKITLVTRLTKCFSHRSYLNR